LRQVKSLVADTASAADSVIEVVSKDVASILSPQNVPVYEEADLKR
jgi:hypothetical protein